MLLALSSGSFSSWSCNDWNFSHIYKFGYLVKLYFLASTLWHHGFGINVWNFVQQRLGSLNSFKQLLEGLNKLWPIKKNGLIFVWFCYLPNDLLFGNNLSCTLSHVLLSKFSEITLMPKACQCSPLKTNIMFIRYISNGCLQSKFQKIVKSNTRQTEYTCNYYKWYFIYTEKINQTYVLVRLKNVLYFKNLFG